MKWLQLFNAFNTTYSKLSLKINTITQLSSFLIFAVLVNQFSLMYLILIAMVLLAALIKIKSQHFLRVIKRLKWFFLVMFTIFTLNTPGEHIPGWPFLFSPTYEGLLAALLQMFRIMTLLAILSLIMSSNTKQQLMSGFYYMVLPLKYLGLQVERFAARLWLTLHYVESNNDLNISDGLLDRLKQFSHKNDVKQDIDMHIELKIPYFNALDLLVILILIVIIIFVSMKAL